MWKWWLGAAAALVLSNPTLWLPTAPVAPNQQMHELLNESFTSGSIGESFGGIQFDHATQLKPERVDGAIQ